MVSGVPHQSESWMIMGISQARGPVGSLRILRIVPLIGCHLEEVPQGLGVQRIVGVFRGPS